MNARRLRSLRELGALLKTTADRKNPDNLIRRPSSVLGSPLDFLEVVAQRRRRRRRTKLSLFVNDKHSDNTGELHQ